MSKKNDIRLHPASKSFSGMSGSLGNLQIAGFSKPSLEPIPFPNQSLTPISTKRKTVSPSSLNTSASIATLTPPKTLKPLDISEKTKGGIMDNLSTTPPLPVTPSGSPCPEKEKKKEKEKEKEREKEKEKEKEKKQKKKHAKGEEMKLSVMCPSIIAPSRSSPCLTARSFPRDLSGDLSGRTTARSTFQDDFIFKTYKPSSSQETLDTGKVTDTPVLVVGEGTVTTAAVAYFKQLEYLSTYQASTVQDALSLLKQKKVKVILCQSVVGEVNVLDFVEHANSLIDDLHFIVITNGNPTEEVLEKYAACSVNDYITSPITLEALKARVVPVVESEWLKPSLEIIYEDSISRKNVKSRLQDMLERHEKTFQEQRELLRNLREEIFKEREERENLEKKFLEIEKASQSVSKAESEMKVEISSLCYQSNVKEEKQKCKEQLLQEITSLRAELDKVEANGDGVKGVIESPLESILRALKELQLIEEDEEKEKQQIHQNTKNLLPFRGLRPQIEKTSSFDSASPSVMISLAPTTPTISLDSPWQKSPTIASSSSSMLGVPKINLEARAKRRNDAVRIVVTNLCADDLNTPRMSDISNNAMDKMVEDLILSYAKTKTSMPININTISPVADYAKRDVSSRGAARMFANNELSAERALMRSNGKSEIRKRLIGSHELSKEESKLIDAAVDFAFSWREIQIPSIDTWDFNPHLMDENSMLAAIMHIFDSLQLLQTFRIYDEKLIYFLLIVQESYSNPDLYFSFAKALDVTQAIYMILQTTHIKHVLNDVDILALIVASICHDINHLGCDNNTLIESGNVLAQLYNGVSILEQYHCSSTFKLLAKNKRANFLSTLEKSSFKDFRNVVIQSILSTDKDNHYETLNKFTQHLKAKPFSSSAEDRALLCSFVMYFADQSAFFRPFDISSFWADKLLMSSAKTMGDEAELDEPSAHDFLKSKLSLLMIDYIVQPLLVPLIVLLPGLEELQDVLQTNRKKWEEIFEQKLTFPQVVQSIQMSNPDPEKQEVRENKEDVVEKLMKKHINSEKLQSKLFQLDPIIKSKSSSTPNLFTSSSQFLQPKNANPQSQTVIVLSPMSKGKKLSPGKMPTRKELEKMLEMK
eukprot:TRINITY_DN1205_c0_g2_i1.p1 TRINITY_DN1205_c0_g2~~TRINITY_DN1205_c0_g2_i1.p1  ORF type:complete len:1130 (+),score=342.22 TRINITY_DN1205_c0_g2_i1:74-3391(+)